LREVAVTLKREPLSLDEIADKLFAGEFETKNDLREINWDKAPEEWGLSLRVCNMIKLLLEKENKRECSIF
jgi:hypothetical protein